MRPPITIVGIPMDLGQARRGVDMGPSALRYAGLQARLEGLGYAVEDLGNLEIAERSVLPPEGGMAFLPAVVRACERMYGAGREAIAQGRLPIFVGGDHSISVGTIGGVTHDGPCGVLWIDAHGDFNTPATTPSGNIHGMPLAASLGYGDPALTEIAGFSPKVRWDRTVLIGARDVDRGERALLREAGIRTFTMREIDEDGIVPVLEEALAIVSEGTAGFLVSWDMDFVDPNFAPGVGTAVKGGVDYREGHLALEIVSDTDGMIAMDLVETNPILDEHNRTGRLGMELILSAFGKTIL
jgi:arginase